MTQAPSPPGMRWIPGGAFRMGADLSYPEEGPAHDVTVGAFWIDEYAVTNAEFATFGTTTGCVKVADRCSTYSRARQQGDKTPCGSRFWFETSLRRA
jgi:formylglycine-generating enzyme required for sulfatase activity